MVSHPDHQVGEEQEPDDDIEHEQHRDDEDEDEEDGKRENNRESAADGQSQVSEIDHEQAASTSAAGIAHSGNYSIELCCCTISPFVLAAVHSPALEERMTRLEEKVDGLRELMMRILRQMES